MSALFVLDRRVRSTTSVALGRAMVVAEAILRSDVYSEAVRNMFDGYGKTVHQFSDDDLKNLLNTSVITLDLGRTVDQLSCKASVQPTYDPSRIYISPMLLLEIKIREDEHAEYIADNFDITSSGLAFGFNGINLCDKSSKKLHSRPDFNSYRYVDQLELLDQYQKAYPCDPPASGSGQKQYTHRLAPNTYWNNFCGVDKPPKFEGIVKHWESPHVTNTLFLTILLVHEASELINRALSQSLERDHNTGHLMTTTGFFRFNRYKAILISQYGHMVERVLFGHVIYHSCNKYFNSPFAIEHIVGSDREKATSGVILTPSIEFQTILTDPSKLPQHPITKEMLQLRPGAKFEGEILHFASKSRTMVVAQSLGALEPLDSRSPLDAIVVSQSLSVDSSSASTSDTSSNTAGASSSTFRSSVEEMVANRRIIS